MPSMEQNYFQIVLPKLITDQIVDISVEILCVVFPWETVGVIFGFAAFNQLVHDIILILKAKD